ncbi:MAG: NADH-quinone oxidoreductase subunit L [Saprospiraceae bacterium]|jgi:NADH-quinone oxidoreductase subunit L|nr:NADH-quinone oxidoreductase subunit L [Saprospiraceae bacterium]MBP9210336.1 NADH-quinone oxidoreductase subunit L [Saprospiraceae bacterium]
MNPELILHLILWPPLAGFLINGVFGARMPKWLVSTIACFSPLLSFAASVAAYIQLAGQATTVKLYTWFVGEGSAIVDFSFLIDNLSIVMLFVVSGVGTLIHVYSIGYMSGDRGFHRFFAYLNLFVFFMLLLVLGSNLVVLFAGWEGVGLCSFLLIGFWYDNLEYNRAASKAFVMNRIGDLAFLVAIFLTIYTTGAVSFADVHDTMTNDVRINDPAYVAISLLFFIGVCGKSAQIPLFTWLPDAMAGPTPVSALIHAATMVTAGIYLIARMHFMYDLVPVTQLVIGITGCLTALVAATIALKQNDIKKILAYSTVSQLGFMAVALAAGAYITAIFHLVTHSFFKALLFLGAGSVIHGLHGEQDIRQMGGLRHKMRWTYGVMLVGTIAIAGLPPLSGFFSKDEILTAVHSHNMGFFIALALASAFTAWYMFRMFASVFHGAFRGKNETWEHVHEAPWSMRGPLVVLAVLSLAGGLLGLPAITGQSHRLYNFLVPAIVQPKISASHAFEYALWGISLAVILTLLVICFKRYGSSGPSVPSVTPSFFERLLVNKYFIDEIYERLFVHPLKIAGSWLMHRGDYGIIDRVVHFPGKVVESGAFALRNLQDGKLSSYLLYSVVALLIFLTLFLIF